MHLNHIKSFLAVSKTLNFTNAAKQNGVPQSTISRHINDLEQQLGVRLFYGTKRDVRLTEEGRTFLPYAQEILEAATKGAYAVRQLHDGAKGRLSVATIPTAIPFLRKCLELFGQKYPDITVDITYVSSGESLMEENDDPYDFHFLYTDMLPDTDDFDFVETHTEQLAFVLPANYDTDSKRADISALKHEKFIILSEEESPLLYMQFMNLCRTHRFTPNITNQFSDIKSVLLSVSAGLGISMMPMILPTDPISNSLQFIPVDDENYSMSCAAAWKKSLLNPAASLFLEIVEQQAEHSEQ